MALPRVGVRAEAMIDVQREYPPAIVDHFCRGVEQHRRIESAAVADGDTP
jgi:hypothetical protein